VVLSIASTFHTSLSLLRHVGSQGRTPLWYEQAASGRDDEVTDKEMGGHVTYARLQPVGLDASFVF